MKIAYNLALIAIVIGLIYLIFIKPSESEELAEYFKDKAYVTDTIRVPVPYSVPRDSFIYKVPPHTVFTYEASIPEWYFNNLRDSLIRLYKITVKGDTVIKEIKPDFITLYPEASKLIYAEFHRDSIKMDLLKVDGKIYTNFYPLNYNRYSYQWMDNSLRAEEVKKLPMNSSSKRFLVSSFVYGGYDFMMSNPIIGIDGAIYKNRYRMGANVNLGIDKTPYLQPTITIGYKLK
jgi:hypothetical protein